jgi:N4-gp56 family major capsid protein
MPLTHTGSATTYNGTLPVNNQLIRQLLLTAKSNAPFMFGTMPGTLMKHTGTLSVKWERIENLVPVSTPLTPITTESFPTRTGVVPVIVPVVATVAKYGNVIAWEEDLDLATVNARAANWVAKIGENAGRSINVVARNTWDAETTTKFSGGATSTATVDTLLQRGDIQFAENAIARKDGMRFMPITFGNTNIGTGPIRASYVGLTHVDCEQMIRDIPGALMAPEYGNQVTLHPGEFAYADGVRWISSSFAPVAAGGGAASTTVRNTGGQADVYTSFIYGKEALGSVGLGERHIKEIYETGTRIPTIELIQKALGSAGAADALNERGTIGWKGWAVFKVLNGDWFQKLEHAAPILT